MEGYTLIMTESRIIISGLSILLRENGIGVRVKSDTIPGYDLSFDVDELFIDDKDLIKATGLVNNYKKRINRPSL